MSRQYDKPEVVEYGAVESITTNLDKIGDRDDGIGGQSLDGSLVPDIS